MTKALYDNNENVNIIAYNQREQERMKKLLKSNKVGTTVKKDTMINFYQFQTNDVWIRDNGPIFIRNESSLTTILDWNFNGWGNKVRFAKDNAIPRLVNSKLKMPIVDLNKVMTLEGGSFEHDGRGTFLATKSAILNNNRNPSMTQQQAETILDKYIGVKNFIWFNGSIGTDLTDSHIDGFARFATNDTIITMNEADLDYYYVSKPDIQILYDAKDINGVPYNIERIPLTKKNVITTYGENLNERGSYCNFYVANGILMIPWYNDENDNVVKAIFEKLFSPLNRKVIQIDCRNLMTNGGMIHCVTQQQPK